MTAAGRRGKTAAPVPLERDVQKGAFRYLRVHGWTPFRRNVAGTLKLKGYPVTLGVKGQSDIWGWTPDGYHFELEMKRPGERPTWEQTAWLHRTNGAGRCRSVSFWVSSIEDLAQVCKRVESGWRVVYDVGPKIPRAEYHLEPPGAKA